MILHDVAGQVVADQIAELKLQLEQAYQVQEDSKVKVKASLSLGGSAKRSIMQSKLRARVEGKSNQEPDRKEETLAEKLERLQRMSPEEKFVYLCAMLQCDDPARFRRKMSGMVLPFSTRDKTFRIATDSPGRKYKLSPLHKAKKPTEEVQQGLVKLRLVRKQAVVEKRNEEQRKYERCRNILNSIRDKQQQSHQPHRKADSLPANGRHAQTLEPLPQPRLTLELLSGMSYADVGADGFNPADFVIDDGGADDLSGQLSPGTFHALRGIISASYTDQVGAGDAAEDGLRTLRAS